MYQLLYKKFLTFLTRIMERIVDFFQYCTVLAEPGPTLADCFENPRAARIQLWRSGMRVRGWGRRSGRKARK